MKRTHKFKGLGDVGKIVAESSSISAAAKTLGVQRSTLHRWIKAGKVAGPNAEPAPAAAAGPVDGQTPGQWAATVRATCMLDATAQVLLGLAVDAFVLARTDPNPQTRLEAVGRFQQLVKQLNLKAKEEARQADAAPQHGAPTRVRRTGTDPRAFLMAVK